MQANNKYELRGLELVIAAIMIAASNAIVLLDMTIANVSVSDIAGGLAVSVNEGTYVITSYSIAEAIVVPLTGWLAARFGTVRTYTTCIMMFGFFSFMCGISENLETLVFFRLMQGVSGGPLMPLSQSLLMLIFPKEKKTFAMTVWSMTTLAAPIFGPILGGYICDNWGWSWIFFVNIPLAVFFSISAKILLTKFETQTVIRKIDFVGLLLLVIFVGALQITLDQGHNKDWYSSNFIIATTAISVIGFIAFLIWELYEEHPIVNLRIFENKTYTMCVVSIGLIFGAYFSSIVLLPIWLQENMGYTAFLAGIVLAGNGVAAIISAPIASILVSKYEIRKLVVPAMVWLAIVSFVRSYNTNEMSFFDISYLLYFQGAVMPLAFIGLTSLALSSVNPDLIASAAGQMNFVRTICGAFGTSISVALWSNFSITKRDELVGALNYQNIKSVPIMITDNLVQKESVTLALNSIFEYVSLIYIIAGIFIFTMCKIFSIKTIIEKK